MTRHIFGATSSPGCATDALRETANRYEGEFGKRVADFIRRDFYCDDGLKSERLTPEASSLIEGAHQLSGKGKFNLRQYASNNKEVVAGIPVELRAKNLQNFRLQSSLMPIERTLMDTFQFQVDLK
jgi:hypothetical protein